MLEKSPSPIEPHAVHSRRLMEHARDQLLVGDRLQASEKAWGAFAHALKVVADERDWEYADHRQVNPLVNALMRESGDEELHVEAGIAQFLHTNYYRDEQSVEDIALYLDRVDRAINRLHQISRRYQADPEYKRRADGLVPPGSRYDTRTRDWVYAPVDNGARGVGP